MLLAPFHFLLWLLGSSQLGLTPNTANVFLNPQVHVHGPSQPRVKNTKRELGGKDSRKFDRQ